MTNRISPYEAGWLTLLVRQGIASEAEAREAMNRVAQEAVEELRRRNKVKKKAKKRRDQE